VLRGELAALKPHHLRNVLHAYELEVGEGVDVATASHAELAELIVGGVRARVGG